jgi:aminoglycoside phosphotransferase family enzyme/predicted kinase
MPAPQAADPQAEVIAFLRDPASYPGPAAPVETIETHISILFLAGSRAYKLKRAVKYSYVDFSTMEHRRAACTAELAVNRRTAPQLYLEVRTIVRRPDGTLAWSGEGEALDWVVVMRRFEPEKLLENVALEGGLTAPLMLALTAHIAEFHDRAEARPKYGGGTVIAGLIEANVRCLRECRDAGFDAGRLARIESRLRVEAARCGALVDQRRSGGSVRRCHGDLHLRNICLLDGRPVLFDAIEFSEEIASVDVLYDVAFLLMDLGHRGHRELANLVFNRYLDLTEEDDGLAAMPLFQALRAVIHAHVTATAAARAKPGEAEQALREARSYLDHAEGGLASRPPRLVAIGGPSGSGKSSLAARLAPEVGVLPGARILRSDVLRKRRFGLEPETPLPPEGYTAAVTAQVYRDLRNRAATALRAGYSAIIDAVALRPEERQEFADVAAECGVPFTGLWLDAPAEKMRARIAARRGDASDATGDILDRQLSIEIGPLDWTRLNAGADPDAVLAGTRRALGLN